VCFMTDGYVGNDMEIIDAVKKIAGTTRVFAFGIGNSVNRFLLDGMASAGRGEVEYVTLDSKAQEAADRFYRRIDAPVLTDVSIDFGNLPVAEVYPKLVPDLFSNKPVVVHGRLTGEVPDGAALTLRGNTANGAFERKVAVKPAAAGASHEALASLWARSKVADLMARDYAALQSGNFPEELKRQIVATAVPFRLMTQFTSFVAVEEMTVTKGGVAQKITVPVEMPDGVSYQGIFGENGGGAQPVAALGLASVPAGNTLMYARGAVAVSRNGSASADAFALRPSANRSAAAASGGLVARKTESLSETQLSDKESAAAVTAPAAPPDPTLKLDESIRGLAEKVQKDGKDGSLKAGNVTVAGFKVDVMVYLADVSEKTRAALKRLGFEQTAESKAVRLLVGTIDVRNLADLAKLDAVIAVKPLGG